MGYLNALLICERGEIGTIKKCWKKENKEKWFMGYI